MTQSFMRSLLFFSLILSANKIAVEPLFQGERSELRRYLAYTSFDQFVNESDSVTEQKQSLALTLQEMNIPLRVSQSQGLLLAQGAIVKPYLKNLATQIPTLPAAFDRILTIEQQINERGNYVVYHGTSPWRYALAYFDKKLLEAKINVHPNFLPLRQPTKTYTPIGDPVALREEYLTRPRGSSFYHELQFWLGEQDRYHLLFTNNALTANLYGRPFGGESALSFFLGHESHVFGFKEMASGLRRVIHGQPEEDPIKDLFTKHGLQDAYATHKAEIEACLNQKIYGNIMLQCEISPNLLLKTVYPSATGGGRTSVRINKQKIIDSAIVFDALKNKPFSIRNPHLILCCAILTDDLWLNPQAPDTTHGLRIHVHSLEPNKLTMMQHTIDTLVANIFKERSTVDLAASK
jgi:hypothetical protein